MSLALRIQLFTLLTFVAVTGFVYVTFAPVTPSHILRISLGIAGLYIAIWIVWILWRLISTQHADDNETADQTLNIVIMWMGNAVTIGSIWLLLPYGDDALRMLLVIFYMGTVAVEVFGTVRRPPYAGRGSLAPLAIPLAVVVFFLLHGGRFALPVALFIAAFGAVMMALRQLVQRSVNATYDARQASEIAARDLQAALEVVAAERDAKTRFIASASHDLGQPLQAAGLFFDQVLRSTDATLRGNAVQGVRRAFAATEQLLGQMLEHLRLESGAVTAHLRPIVLGPLLARVASLHEAAAQLAGIELRTRPSRLVVHADDGLVERALSNLIDNALRHGKGGRVMIGARACKTRVRIWVIDDGVGIVESDLPRLFEDYVQGSNHADEIRGGFGLGLASAQRMAALMGGVVALDRRFRRGSAFFLELPRHRPQMH